MVSEGISDTGSSGSMGSADYGRLAQEKGLIMYKFIKFKCFGRSHCLEITFYPQLWGICLGIWKRTILLTILCFEFEYYWSTSILDKENEEGVKSY